MCNAHYLRWWRHGDPLHGRAMMGEPMQWIAALPRDKGECIEWPFGVANNGSGTSYGSVRFEGRAQMASHVVAVVFHAPAPEGKPYAAHRCGNSLCSRPQHIYWASGAENQADRKLHGTAGNDKAKHVRTIIRPD